MYLKSWGNGVEWGGVGVGINHTIHIHMVVIQELLIGRNSCTTCSCKNSAAFLKEFPPQQAVFVNHYKYVTVIAIF